MRWSACVLCVVVLCHITVAIRTPQDMVKGAPQVDQNICTFCEVLATMWTQPDISHDANKTEIAVKKFCSDLPKPLDHECTVFVTERGLGMIKLLQGGWSPERLCTRFGKCTSGFQAVDPPKAGTQLGNHIDENDMPAKEQLGRPELVPANLRSVKLKDPTKEIKGQEAADTDVQSMLQLLMSESGSLDLGEGLGYEMARAKDACATLWVTTFNVAIEWMQPDPTNKAKATNNANAMAAFLQQEHSTNSTTPLTAKNATIDAFGEISVVIPQEVTKEGDLLISALTNPDLFNNNNNNNNKINNTLPSHHMLMLEKLTSHLEQLKALKTAQNQKQNHQSSALLQEANAQPQQQPQVASTTTSSSSSTTTTAAAAAAPSLKDSVDRIHALAEDVLNVQLGLGAGRSEMWISVVHVYWSFLFASWIRGQIDGTGTL